MTISTHRCAVHLGRKGGRATARKHHHRHHRRRRR